MRKERLTANSVDKARPCLGSSSQIHPLCLAFPRRAHIRSLVVSFLAFQKTGQNEGAFLTFQKTGQNEGEGFHGEASYLMPQ
jgi:hypothetical protein